MAETRQYFSSETERNKALESGSGLTYGTATLSGGKQVYFVEKQVLTSQEAKSLGYGQGVSGGIHTTSIQALRESGRVAPQAGMAVSGATTQILAELQKSYESGDFDPSYSARITGSGDAKKVEFYKTAKGQESIISYSEPQEVAQGEVQTGYVYEIAVEDPGQVQDVEAWARKYGLKTERTSTPEELKAGGGFKVQITSDRPLTDDRGEWLDKSQGIMVRSKEQIRQEKITTQSKVAGEEAYAKASPVEKALLSASTFLSVKGYEFLGALVNETPMKDVPLAKIAATVSLPPGLGNVVGELAGKATEKLNVGLAVKSYFGKVKSTEQVVKERLIGKIERVSQGIYAYNVSLPVLGDVQVDETILDMIANPAVDIETVALGGAGLGKVAATKTGAAVLGSKLGKGLLIGGTAAYTGQRAVEIESLRQTGQGTEALGKVVATIGGFAAGVAAYKAQIKHSFSVAAEKTKPVQIELQKIQGKSDTVQLGKQILSKGKFVITEGKLTGLKGETFLTAAAKKGRGQLITRIPEQTVSKTKIPAQTIVRYVEDKPPLKTQIGRIFQRTANEAKLMVNQRTVKPVGTQKSETFLKQTARVTRDTSSGEKITIRRFVGIAEEKRAGKYGLAIVTKKTPTGTKSILVEESVLKAKTYAKIDWVDVSKMSPTKGGIVKIYSPGTARPTGTMQVRPVVDVAPRVTPAVPAGAVKVQAVPDVARIVYNVNPTPAGIKIKSQPKAELAVRQVGTPNIVRPQEQKPQGRTVQSGATQLLVKTPQIERFWNEQAQKLSPAQIAITHPITGQTTSQKEVTAVRSALEPIIDRIGNQPIPVTPSNLVKPPFMPPGGFYIPFLRLGGSKINIKRFKLGVLKNPVPEIEKVM